VASSRRALEIKPGYAAAHNNLGAVLSDLGLTDEAIAQFRNATHFDPDYPDAHMNLGMLLLSKGQFEEGWSHYEWRLKTQGEAFKRGPMITRPLWDGRPLEGRSILLHAEQGLGDTLQFVRYAALVRDKGGKVLVECPAPFCRCCGAARGSTPWVRAGQNCRPLTCMPRFFRSRGSSART
jgi:tetratricopeptide (TPR) repeat protein